LGIVLNYQEVFLLKNLDPECPRERYVTLKDFSSFLVEMTGKWYIFTAIKKN